MLRHDVPRSYRSAGERSGWTLGLGMLLSCIKKPGTRLVVPGSRVCGDPSYFFKRRRTYAAALQAIRAIVAGSGTAAAPNRDGENEPLRASPWA